MKLGYEPDVKISVDLVRDFKRDVQQVLEAEVKGKRGAGGVGKMIKADVGEGLGLCVSILTCGKGG